MSAARVRVGVNLLWLVPGDVGGSEDYALALVRELAGADEIDLVVFCQPALRRAYPDLDDIATVVVGPGRGQVRSLRLFWENSWLPYQVRHLGLDLVHHLGGTVPPVGSTRAVLTVYDLQPLTHPERFRPAKRAWLRTALPRSARHATKVLTLSEHVRQHVVRHLGVAPHNVLWCRRACGAPAAGTTPPQRRPRPLAGGTASPPARSCCSTRPSRTPTRTTRCWCGPWPTWWPADPRPRWC